MSSTSQCSKYLTLTNKLFPQEIIVGTENKLKATWKKGGEMASHMTVLELVR